MMTLISLAMTKTKSIFKARQMPKQPFIKIQMPMMLQLSQFPRSSHQLGSLLVRPHTQQPTVMVLHLILSL